MGSELDALREQLASVRLSSNPHDYERLAEETIAYAERADEDAMAMNRVANKALDRLSLADALAAAVEVAPHDSRVKERLAAYRDSREAG